MLGSNLRKPWVDSTRVYSASSDFVEKPSLSTAEFLLKSASLWNTFVMVGHAATFLELAGGSVPGLMETLRSRRILATPDGEIRIDGWLYDKIAATDFSRQVLSPTPSRLISLGLADIEWSDLGDPDRVVSTLLHSALELPSWVERWRDGGTQEPPESRSSASMACT